MTVFPCSRAAHPDARGLLVPAAPAVSPLASGRRLIGVIVALVDGEPITRHELDQAMARQRWADAAAGADVLRARALQALIEAVLARHCARDLGITVSEQAIGRAARRLSGGAEGEAAWQEAAQAWGLSWSGVRAALHEQILRKALLGAALAQAAPQGPGGASMADVPGHATDQPGTGLCRAVRLRQIMLGHGGPQEAAAGERLLALRRRITCGGEDFAALARACSVDGSARQGGDIGWLAEQRLPPEFAAAIARLAPGELSEPFASRLGWHLVQVTARRARRVAAAGQQARAQRQAREQAARALVASWIAQRRARARIEYWPQRAERGLGGC